MGLETVIKDILDVAQTEVSNVNVDSESEVSQILEDARLNAKKIKGDRLVKADEDIARLRRQETSSANLEVKRTMLNARKEVLDKVYNKALETIVTLPDSKQEELLKSIIEKNESIGTKIYSNKDSEEFVRKLSSLDYAGNIDCIGGVVIENEDSTIRLDYTYDIILQRVNEQSLKQTSDILFG